MYRPSGLVSKVRFDMHDLATDQAGLSVAALVL